MRYRFGELELDTESHQLRRSGTPIELWPKVFDLLRYLIEQRGRLVSKQELLDRVWADSHVAEGSVLWTISHARRALGQRSGQKLPIETLHKRGYRFTADVEVLMPSPAPAVALEHRESPRRPFVGRDDVMAELHARLRDAQELKHGELCVLVGPPGIGKTRCLDEMLASADARRFDVLLARCVEDTWTPVFWPWTVILRDVARARPALSPRVDALLARLHQGASEDTFWWFDGVSRLLLEAAAERPVLILLDDLQWADAATIELLVFLAPELRRNTIVVIATLRAEGSSAQLPAFKRIWRHAYRIDVEPLTEADVARYVRLVTASDAVELGTVEAMHRATAGNPLFLEHSLRAWQARRDEAAAGSGPLQVIAPAQIARDTLGASLERLDANTREALRVASVLGDRFGLSELQALCGLEPEALLAMLEPAVREAIVIAEDPITLRFCHALMRVVLYEDLPIGQRATLHRRTAEVLERLDGARLGEIAHHYYRSLALGDHDRIARAAERAARAASRLHAFADACRFSGWAVEAQILEQRVPPRTRAELLLFHAQMQAGAGAEAAARETIQAVVTLARAHDLTDLLVGAARILRPFPLMGSLEDPYLRTILEEALERAPQGANATRVSALSQLAWLPPYALDIDKSKAMSAEALAFARELGDEKLVLRALTARLHALSGPDDCDALLATAAEMQALDRMPRAWGAAAVCSARHAAHLYRGEMSAAVAARVELGRLAQAHQWPVVTWLHDRFVVQAHILSGELAAASTALETMTRHAERWRVPFAAEMRPVLHGLIMLETRGVRALSESADLSVLRSALPFTPIGLRPSLARLLLELGETGIAKTVLDELSVNGFAGIPRDIGYLGALASSAVLAIRLDDRPAAHRLYELLAPYPQHNTLNLLSLHEGSVSHFLGLLAVHLGLNEAVERHFDAALEMNERIGQRPQLARTCREYGRWLSTQGGVARERSRELLQRARTLAEAMDLLPLRATVVDGG